MTNTHDKEFWELNLGLTPKLKFFFTNLFAISKQIFVNSIACKYVGFSKSKLD